MIVKVINRHNLKIKKLGGGRIFKKKKNTNTLYVPHFTSNIMFVSKITKNQNCKILFFI